MIGLTAQQLPIQPFGGREVAALMQCVSLLEKIVLPCGPSPIIRSQARDLMGWRRKDRLLVTQGSAAESDARHKVYARTVIGES
jgi:hypothetical protein